MSFFNFFSMGTGAWEHGDGGVGMGVWGWESDCFQLFSGGDGNMILFNFCSICTGAIIFVVSVGMEVWGR